VGCLVLVTIAMIMMVSWAFRAGRIIGLAVLVLAVLVYAAAIALFLICLAVSRI
jgi:hypothetical protein